MRTFLSADRRDSSFRSHGGSRSVGVGRGSINSTFSHPSGKPAWIGWNGRKRYGPRDVGRAWSLSPGRFTPSGSGHRVAGCPRCGSTGLSSIGGDRFRPALSPLGASFGGSFFHSTGAPASRALGVRPSFGLAWLAATFGRGAISACGNPRAGRVRSLRCKAGDPRSLRVREHDPATGRRE
jgi:hypothetical protein